MLTAYQGYADRVRNYVHVRALMSLFEEKIMVADFLVFELKIFRSVTFKIMVQKVRKQIKHASYTSDSLFFIFDILRRYIVASNMKNYPFQYSSYQYNIILLTLFISNNNIC